MITTEPTPARPGAPPVAVAPHDLAAASTTFAEEAGITVRDKPGPLLRLLVLATLLAAPIRHEAALRASRALHPFTRTAAGLAAAEPVDVMKALTRSGYWRFHRTKASLLVRTGAHLHAEHGGDLRRLYRDAADVEDLHRALTAIPGVGAQAAHIVLREAQGVWPDLQPYLDARVLEGAALLHLPTDPDALAATVPPDALPALAAGCVRATLGGRPAPAPPGTPVSADGAQPT